MNNNISTYLMYETMLEPTPLTLPIELISVITQYSETIFHALLSCRAFTETLSVDAIERYKKAFGYSINKGTSKTNWLKHSKLHRNDGPAVIWRDGRREWYKYDLLHCADIADAEPAICENGDKKWYHYGMLHRGHDLPAKVESSGSLTWYYYGQIHRDGDRPAIISSGGDQHWMQNNCLHRTTVDSAGMTLPALIYPNGTMEWYENGIRGRADGRDLPSKIYTDGKMEWYYCNKLHRSTKDSDGLTLPAVIHPDNTMQWYHHGRLHRDDRDADGQVLPAEIYANGDKLWYCHGELHRDGDMPAEITNCVSAWWSWGNLHRDPAVDSPAHIRSNGDKYWYVHGELHRDLALGPAVIKANGAVVKYYLCGSKLTRDH